MRHTEKIGNDLHIHVYVPADPRIDQIVKALNQLVKKENQIMATIQDLEAAVDAETEVVGSVVTLLDGLAQQLADALAQNDPAAIQAVLDDVNANRQALADAAVRNTPAAPEG